MKTVGEYMLDYEAQIAKSKLESEGIMAQVTNEVSSYICINAISPIKVIVNDEDYDEAKRILEDVNPIDSIDG